MGPMPEVHRHIVTLPRGPWVHPMEGGSPQGSSKLTPECVAFGGSRLHPDTATLQQSIGVLQRELDAAHAREQAAQEREALLLQMLQQVQQQSQRLLEAGPPAPVSSHPAPVAVSHRDRGDMRQRIVALLRDYPDGLSPAQTRQRLGTQKDLGSTMKAMLRDGLLRRVALGQYTAAE